MLAEAAGLLRGAGDRRGAAELLLLRHGMGGRGDPERLNLLSANNHLKRKLEIDTCT
jgi:hypothetical protein